MMSGTKSEGEYQASLVDPPPPGYDDVVWTTRDGRKVRLVDMDDSHLTNALRMLRRKFVTVSEFLGACRYAATAPDGAQMAIEQEIDRMQIMPAIFDLLVYEADRRGLAWKVPG